ncbi:MAG: substrate-binding domain-containing protein [Verrucomicrobiales bacterium]|jgi:iron(III) transport system substrate-binding protein|nr:substrate-binding domain-containing protein [Verrucomicrobiales bacterium]
MNFLAFIRSPGWSRSRFGPALVALVAFGCLGLAGCGGGRVAEVVVYAAQDRVFAEPVFAEFTRRTGIPVRAVYDNEATKTTGLAQRLLMESARPLADLWWSNEEMRTRQLVARGALTSEVTTFGRRERVFVTRGGGAPPAGLGALTNTAWRGRMAMAYPVFGSTGNHLLVLRQRWGAAAWKNWCTALAANRPWLVDGNSQVVRAVVRGDAEIGLTDSDDVAFARREGHDVVAHRLAVAEGMVLPNTVALVSGARHPEHARRLAEYLAGAEVLSQLRQSGAVDPESAAPREAGEVGVDWPGLLADLDTGLDLLAEWFVR